MCDFVAPTRCCKLVSFLYFIYITSVDAVMRHYFYLLISATGGCLTLRSQSVYIGYGTV